MLLVKNMVLKKSLKDAFYRDNGAVLGTVKFRNQAFSVDFVIEKGSVLQNF